MSDPPPPGIYQHDPGAAPDEDFETGTLAHLAPGNRGRMLDPRRTPVRVVGVDDSTGMFELVVEGFEDRGAHWRLALEDVGGFQFERGGRLLEEERREHLRRLAERFDVTIELPAQAPAQRASLSALAAERARIRPQLAARPGLRELDLPALIERREGSSVAAGALHALLDAAGLAGLEEAFAETYVSNPGSGEIVKGHAVVLAEMGLCPYAGPIVRDEGLFTGECAKHRRRRHILLRLAFLGELTSMLGLAEVDLFRGMALNGPLEPSRPRSLLAATFSRAVAAAHFDSPGGSAVLARQRVPVSRLFMTFIETPQMSERYREAEAVLIGAPGNRLF